MIKLSGCIEALYTDLTIPERIKNFADAGVAAFEFWGWSNKNLDEIKEAKDEYGLPVATFSCEMGSLVDLKNKSKWIEGAERSIETANKLDCKRLLVTTGNELKNVSRAKQHESIVNALKLVAKLVESADIILTLEPLNVLVNHKGYYLYSSEEGFQIIDEVGSPNIKLLYDIYHQQITEGNLIATITSNIDKIGHFHVADVPGRHEPGTGEINYRNVFKAISDSSYDGYVGLEFWASGDADEAVRSVVELAKF